MTIIIDDNPQDTPHERRLNELWGLNRPNVDYLRIPSGYEANYSQIPSTQPIRTNYNRNTSQGQIHPSATGTPMAAAASVAAAGAQAGGSIFSSLIGALGNVGNNIISQNAQNARQQQDLSFSREQLSVQQKLGSRSLDVQESLGNRSLDFLQKQWQTEWDATKSAGLYHPSQFQGGANGATIGRAYGRYLMPTLRAKPGSTWV